VTNPVAGRGPSSVSLTLVAMVLAVVAGFVDAVGFLHMVNVFPANQSGNVAFLGLSWRQPGAGLGAAGRHRRVHGAAPETSYRWRWSPDCSPSPGSDPGRERTPTDSRRRIEALAG